MLTWHGFEVLEVEPHRPDEIVDERERAYEVLETPQGEPWIDILGPAPVAEFPFTWISRSRAEAAAFRQFVDRMKGSAIPFWVPTRQRNLSLADDVEPEEAILTIDQIGYAALMFSEEHGARRHLVVYARGQAPSCHAIVDAADPGDGLTESITISPAAPVAWKRDETLICFLRLCRLSEDDPEQLWSGTDLMEAVLQLTELPLETPMVEA